MELQLFFFIQLKAIINLFILLLLCFMNIYIYVHAIVIYSCYLFLSHDYVNDSQNKFMLCICNATKH